MSGNDGYDKVHVSIVGVICGWLCPEIRLQLVSTHDYCEAVAIYERTALSAFRRFFMISSQISFSNLFMSSAVDPFCEGCEGCF